MRTTGYGTGKGRARAEAPSVDERLKEQRRRTLELSKMAAATPALRAVRDEHGWPAAMLAMLTRFPVVHIQDVASVFGVAVPAAMQALSRCGFAFNVGRGWWKFADTLEAEGVRAYLADAALAKEHAAYDRARVEPFLCKTGRVHPLHYQRALAALFADGIERSTHRVARAFDSDPCVTRDALARGIAVEPAGVEMWRARPTVEALRARVAELEALLAAKGATT